VFISLVIVRIGIGGVLLFSRGVGHGLWRGSLYQAGEEGFASGLVVANFCGIASWLDCHEMNLASHVNVRASVSMSVASDLWVPRADMGYAICYML